jgi:hypothetical protein
MISDEIRKKLQNIVGGNDIEGEADHCTTIRNLFNKSFGSNPTVKSEFESRSILKEEQASFLKIHSKKLGLWLPALENGAKFLTRGGESEIYLAPDHRNVFKINDAIYYATWTEFLNSLVIHNILFPNTKYELIGFMLGKDGQLCAVLKQPFIQGEQADLGDISEHLIFNGFQNIKRQDYFNKELGLALEDMHDENVIACADVLFFIDTVFYIMGSE